jgi:hypothetical protein
MWEEKVEDAVYGKRCDGLQGTTTLCGKRRLRIPFMEKDVMDCGESQRHVGRKG